MLVALDSQRQAVLSLHTSKYVPDSITLHAAANDGKARFILAQSSLQSENGQSDRATVLSGLTATQDGLTLSFTDSRVHLSGVKPMQDIRIMIPFEAAGDTAQIPVRAQLDWLPRAKNFYRSYFQLNGLIMPTASLTP